MRSITDLWVLNIIQLFNGSAGNRSKYFSRGIWKDQSVNDRVQ